MKKTKATNTVEDKYNSIKVAVTLFLFIGLLIFVLFEDYKQKTEVPDTIITGTLVRVKDVDNVVMITGYCQVNPTTDKVYDYIGVGYLDGYLGSDYNYVFNKEDITSVLSADEVVKAKTEAIARKNEIMNWSQDKQSESEVQE